MAFFIKAKQLLAFLPSPKKVHLNKEKLILMSYTISNAKAKYSWALEPLKDVG